MTSSKFLKKIIESAINNNLMVFNPGVSDQIVDHELIGLMIDTARDNGLGRLSTLHIPPDLMCYTTYNHICGLTVIRTPELSPDGELFSYYISRALELGAIESNLFPLDRDNLLIGVCSNCTNGIFGAV